MTDDVEVKDEVEEKAEEKPKLKTKKSKAVEGLQLGDTVTYTENDQDVVATVLEIRALDEFLGANDEPLVHLGFFIQVYKPGPDGEPVRVSVVGTQQQYDCVQFRYDVAHESLELPENPDGSVPPSYPGGRWKEVSITPEVAPLRREETDEEKEKRGVKPHQLPATGGSRPNTPATFRAGDRPQDRPAKPGITTKPSH